MSLSKSEMHEIINHALDILENTDATLEEAIGVATEGILSNVFNKNKSRNQAPQEGYMYFVEVKIPPHTDEYARYTKECLEKKMNTASIGALDIKYCNVTDLGKASIYMPDYQGDPTVVLFAIIDGDQLSQTTGRNEPDLRKNIKSIVRSVSNQVHSRYSNVTIRFDDDAGSKYYRVSKNQYLISLEIL